MKGGENSFSTCCAPETNQLLFVSSLPRIERRSVLALLRRLFFCCPITSSSTFMFLESTNSVASPRVPPTNFLIFKFLRVAFQCGTRNPWSSYCFWHSEIGNFNPCPLCDIKKSRKQIRKQASNQASKQASKRYFHPQATLLGAVLGD